MAERASHAVKAFGGFPFLVAEDRFHLTLGFIHGFADHFLGLASDRFAYPLASRNRRAIGRIRFFPHGGILLGLAEGLILLALFLAAGGAGRACRATQRAFIREVSFGSIRLGKFGVLHGFSPFVSLGLLVGTQLIL